MQEQTTLNVCLWSITVGDAALQDHFILHTEDPNDCSLPHTHCNWTVWYAIPMVSVSCQHLVIDT
jgi:hypothetical protein